MTTDWKSPKIIIGNTATGDFYYPRPQIESDIWEELRKGNHVLLAAPRRVGKTSVMLSMIGNCPDDTRCLFKVVQGAENAEQFYKQFFDIILECLSKYKTGLSSVKSWLKHLNIEELTLEGVKFGDKKRWIIPKKLIHFCSN